MEQMFSVFRAFKESDKSLKHELESIQIFCLSHMSCWCYGSNKISNTRGGRFEAFHCNDKIFFVLNSANSMK